MRPMFHFTERRIEAHVCISFVAYKVYKELERIIKLTEQEVLKFQKTITFTTSCRNSSTKLHLIVGI